MMHQGPLASSHTPLENHQYIDSRGWGLFQDILWEHESIIINMMKKEHEH